MSPALPTEPTSVRLILDLDPRCAAPTGTLTAHSGAAAPFTGWVGLTRAIELALAADRGEAAATEGERP
jgi:hypothetical protein